MTNKYTTMIKAEVRKSKEKPLGSLCIDSVQLPEIKKWKVGEEYEVKVKIKQTSIRVADDWDIREYKGYTEDTVKADFDIKSIEVVGDKE